MVDFSLLEPAEENEEVSRAKMNVNLAHKFEPQKEASVLKTARETGLTPALVRIREKEIKEQMLTPDVASMALRSPGTTKYLSTLEYASISKGDFDKLEKIEQIKYKEAERKRKAENARKASDDTWGIYKSIGRTALKTVPMLLKTGADISQFVLGKAESDVKKLTALQKALTGVGGIGSRLRVGEKLSGALGYAKEKAREFSGFEKDVLAQKFMNLPEEKQVALWDKPSLLADPEWLVQNVGDAANSMLPVLGATLVGGPGLGAVAGGGMEGASLYDDLVTDGVTEDRARAASVSFGIVSGVLNKIGLDKIMGKVSATTLMKKIALRASAGATEAATEYMEEPFQAAFTGLAKGESGSKIAGRVVESLKNIDVIPGSFILGAGMSRTRQKEAAIENDTFHDNLNKSVNESGTKTLSPIATQAHLESIEVEDQYLSFEGVEMLFQSETGQPILEKLGIDPIQAEDAVTHGADIKISMAQAHAVLSPEEWQTIRPDIKEAPSALTKREADRINPEEEAAAVENKVKEAKERRKAYRAEIQRIKEETTKAGYQPEVSDAFTQILDRFAYTEGQKIDFLKKISVRAGDFQTDENGNILYQTAFHGTPHDFNKFSLDKIGTGEGAQAFGYGLYFAGSKEVAEWYKEKLELVRPATYTVDGNYAGNKGDGNWRDIYLQTAIDGRLEEQITALKRVLDDVGEYRDIRRDYEYAKTLRGKTVRVTEEELVPGRLYQVELAPKENEYLLWDGLIDEQGDKIKSLLEKTEYWEYAEDRLWGKADRSGTNPTGRDLYRDLLEDYDPKEASEFLKSIGIRGIKYLDGSSRGKGEGNYNYVIFDDKDVEITHKNGEEVESGNVLYQSKGVRTLRGAIKEKGGINFLNFKGELKDMTTAVKYLSKKTGRPVDTLENELRSEGWLMPGESLIEALRDNPDILKRGKLQQETQDKPAREYTKDEKKFISELGYEPEEPPAGNYKTISAKDIPIVGRITAITGKGPRGWDDYEIISKDENQIVLRGDEEIILSTNDQIEIKIDGIETELERQLIKNAEPVLAERQGNDAPLAAVTITSDKYIISLFEGANATSIIHEAGHIFHKELEAMAKLPDAPEDLIKDVEDLREYLGVKPGEELTDDQKEKFADSFMLYVEEGKAPTVQLESVFERFRKWMMSVIKKVYVHPEAILNDKIRAIFDRMLGAEAEFKDTENENGFTPLTKAEMDSLGIVPDDQKYMNRLAKEASRKSEIELHKARNKSYGLYIKQWRDAAKIQVDYEPGQRQADDLSLFGGADIEELSEEYGKDAINSMPKRVPPVFRKGGMSLSQAALNGGFDSVEMMLEALKNVRPKKEAIQEIVDEKIREHDQQFHPIDFIVNTDEYRKYMETKAKYIERSGGKTVTTTPQSAYKVYAEKQFRGLMVKDATVISRYLAALKKFAGIEREKVRLKKTEEAMDANEKFRLNYELAGLSSKLREQVKKTEKRAKAFLKSETDNECRQQALKLIKRFGFVEEVQLDEDVKTFSDFLDNQSNSGKPATDPMFEIAPVYSDFLMMESYAKPYKELTVQEFQELDEALRYLKRRGSKLKKGRLLDGITSRDAKVDDLSESILSNKRRVKVRPEDSFFREMSDKKRWYFAHHDTLMFLARRLDGFVTLKGQVGPVENFVTKQINRAEDRNTRLTKEMYEKLKPMSDHFLKRSKEYPKRIEDSGVAVPEVLKDDGRYWTFERVIMLAMHQGNETNRQRLRDGLGMSQGDVQKLIDHVLNDSDWKMVQHTWDAINSLWPDLDAAFFNINDHHQKKVKADSFTTKDGTVLSGGYFPLLYDGSLSKIKAEWNEKEDMMNQIGAMFPSVKPKQGMLEARSKGAVSIPLDLSLSVIQKHIETSLRYITHAEILTDINSVIKQPKFRKAVTDVEGKHIYDEIRPALAFVAHPKIDSDQLNNWLMREVKRSSSYMLYLNAKSATNQFFGVITAFSTLGNGNTALGMARFIKASLKVARQPFQMHAELMNIDYMRKREKEGGDRDFARSRKMMKPNNIDIKGYTWEDVQDFGFSMMRAVDALTVTPVWYAAYDKGMAENGGDRQKAIEAANDVIRTTQESKEASDLNAFQRSTGWHRLFTMFSAFAQKYGTLQRFHYAAWKEGAISTPKYLSIIAMDNIGQPLITSLAFSLLWGKFDEDDTIADVVGAQFMGLFMIREIVGGAIRMGGRKGNGVSSPALAGVEMMYNTTTSLINLVTELDNEDNWESAGLGLAELLSYQARVPAPKLYRNIVKGIDQFENDDGTIFNIIAPDNRR